MNFAYQSLKRYIKHCTVRAKVCYNKYFCFIAEGASTLLILIIVLVIVLLLILIIAIILIIWCRKKNRKSNYPVGKKHGTNGSESSNPNRRRNNNDEGPLRPEEAVPFRYVPTDSSYNIFSENGKENVKNIF